MIYLVVLFAGVLSWWLAWWWIVFLGFAIGQLSSSKTKAFSHGFISIFVLWMALCYYFDLQSHGLISQRISEVFKLPWPPFAILLSAAIGGFVTALAALSSYEAKKLLAKVS